MTKPSASLPEGSASQAECGEPRRIGACESLIPVEVVVPARDVRLVQEVAAALRDHASRSKTRLLLRGLLVGAGREGNAPVETIVRDIGDSDVTRGTVPTSAEKDAISRREPELSALRRWTVALLGVFGSPARPGEAVRDTSGHEGERCDQTLKEMFFSAPLEGIDLERNRRAAREVDLPVSG